jgi:hypothetical protein
MRKLSQILHVCIIISMVWFIYSCQDKNTWDPIPGLDKIPPPAKPEVQEKFSRVQDPRIAKDVNYWIFSANDTVGNISYQKGLMVRRSPDLVEIKVIGYVLSNVIDSWAQAKLLELDATVDITKIRMRLPSIEWDGTQWRLYYTVTANTQASVIGYATSPSLENQAWTDKGFVLGSAPGDPVKAAGPSFVALPDNSKHYLAYGAKFGGIYLVELDKTTGLPIGGFGNRIAFYSTDGTNQRIGFPEIVYNSATNFYYLFMTCDDGDLYGQNIEVIRSVNVTGPYLGYNDNDYSVTGRVDDGNLWNSSHILSPYAMYDSARVRTPGWGETGSMGVIKDGNNWFAVNNARLINRQIDWDRIICEGPFSLQIRNLDWLSDKNGWPVVQPTYYNPYSGDEDNTPLSQDISMEDIVGDWDYATRWYERAPKFLNPPGVVFIQFKADGTLGGISGTWTYDASSKRILMISATWGNEQIAMVVRRTKDNDYNKSVATYPTILSAAGYNNTFGQKPVVWMKQRPKQN